VRGCWVHSRGFTWAAARSRGQKQRHSDSWGNSCRCVTHDVYRSSLFPASEQVIMMLASLSNRCQKVWTEQAARLSVIQNPLPSFKDSVTNTSRLLDRSCSFTAPYSLCLSKHRAFRRRRQQVHQIFERESNCTYLLQRQCPPNNPNFDLQKVQSLSSTGLFVVEFRFTAEETGYHREHCGLDLTGFGLQSSN
jgi:hypothetical protein